MSSKKKEEEKDVSSLVIDASVSEKEISDKIVEPIAERKVSFEEAQNTEEEKLSKNHSHGAQNEEENEFFP